MFSIKINFYRKDGSAGIFEKSAKPFLQKRTRRHGVPAATQGSDKNREKLLDAGENVRRPAVRVDKL